MRKSLLTLTCFAFSACLFSACSTSGTQETESTEIPAKEKTELTITPAPASPEFLDAMLRVETPTEGQQLSKSVRFTYNVTNYELGTQTEDASQKPIANSGEGQHIHLMLNNEPYVALYEPEYQTDLEEGHYTALSFLSRSYHESVKSPEAYMITQFNVGNTQEEPADLSAPMLFYSRPKGTYTGKDTEKVLLDFYVLNTELSSGGHQVKVTVNSDTTFMVDQWEPMLLAGLPMGENTVKIELVNAQGKLVDSPVNGAERTFTLEEVTEPAS